MMSFLLTEGADVIGGDSTGGPDLTPLHLAVSLRQTDAVRLLLEHRADVNALDKRGQTPLHVAVMTHNEEIADLLVAGGADVEA